MPTHKWPSTKQEIKLWLGRSKPGTVIGLLMFMGIEPADYRSGKVNRENNPLLDYGLNIMQAKLENLIFTSANPASAAVARDYLRQWFPDWNKDKQVTDSKVDININFDNESGNKIND